ncbi:MAG: flagellar biosynthesis regulatory protein FlaF [Cereibacter sphaeroides]|uniref:Flagellar biosynthesis regulatory protein FlaF n=1 Tax=Cereibacter sphaeroides TaxID=1063 RepID=A0A2W5UI82_CERSP|nr:MAG: flagellar biosynthesis regulatory protein FlaF [Cereibacter sphaeroides]
MARTAYSAPGTPARSLRGIEYDVFARVTHGLKAGLTAGRAEFPKLAGALHENNQLWAVLAADVADKDNGLPAPLRAQLFYLYEFTLQHSRKVIAGTASPEVLIDINTAVMRGLRGEGAAP